MRKIEREMIAAVRALSPRRLGNTEITTNPGAGYADVHLHGHHIATIYPERPDGYGPARHVMVALAGWDTPTTRSRLRALLRAFDPDVGLVHKAGRSALVDPARKVRVDLSPFATVGWEPGRSWARPGIGNRSGYYPDGRPDAPGTAASATDGRA